MTLQRHLLMLVFATLVCSSCRRNESASVLLVQVLRDPHSQFAATLRQQTDQFTASKPHVAGKNVLIATNEGGPSFAAELPHLLAKTKPEILILNSESDLPNDAGLRDELGKSELVCGRKLAYIPSWVGGPKREAAEMYIRFLKQHCS